MILMRMRDEHAEQIVLLADGEADIRQDKIDAGKIGAGEGNAAIDHDPLAILHRTKAVECEIHADLADAAQWQEYQFVRARHHCDPSFREKKTSPEAMRIVSPESSLSASNPSLSMPANMPEIDLSGKLTVIAWPTPWTSAFH